MKYALSLSFALAGMIAINGCSASDLIDSFSAQEAKSTDEIKVKDYKLIVNDINKEKCDKILIKAVAVKYGFEDPLFYNNGKNHTSCEELDKEGNSDHCADVSAAEIDDLPEGFAGEAQCILATDTKPDSDAYQEALDENK